MRNYCQHGSASRGDCDECRQAQRTYHQTSVKWRQMLLSADPGLRPHGTVSTYQHWGCRCAECKAASAAYRSRYRASARRQYRARKTAPFREWVDAISSYTHEDGYADLGSIYDPAEQTY